MGCAASSRIVKESTKEMVTIKGYHDEKPRHTKNDDSDNDFVCDQLCGGADTPQLDQQSAQQRERCRKIQAHDPIWLSINAEPDRPAAAADTISNTGGIYP
jgi:hypothetical protein